MNFNFSALKRFMCEEELRFNLKNSFEKSHMKYAGILSGERLITHESLMEFASKNLNDECVRLFKVKNGIQSELMGSDRYDYIFKNRKEVVEKEIKENGAIIISKPELYFNQFHELIDAIQACFGCEATGSLIHSPGRSAPTSIHHDSYHVFAIQISGKKDWKIFDSPENLNAYRDGLSNRLTYTSKNLDIIDQFTLEENDVLYVPPGLYHHVTNSYGEDSIHISITLRFDRYISVFERVVQNALVRMSYESKNRAAFDSSYRANNNIFQNMKAQLLDIVDESILRDEYMQALEEKINLASSKLESNTERLLRDVSFEDDVDLEFSWVNYPNLVKYEYNNQVSVYFERSKSIVFDRYLWELISLNKTFLLFDIKEEIHFEERWLAVIRACAEDYGAFRVSSRDVGGKTV